MAKTLSFSDESPQAVKHGDTTTVFELVCGDDNVPTDLTGTTSITVKIGDSSGQVKEHTVDPTTLTDPETGIVEVPFNDSLVSELAVGIYQLEVWVVSSAGTSIYPGNGTLQFQINSSLE